MWRRRLRALVAGPVVIFWWCLCTAAGHAEPRRANTAALYVVNATGVVLIDSLGRRVPCMDSTCRPIPQAISYDPLMQYRLVQDQPRRMIEAPASCAHYTIEARGVGGAAWVLFTVGCDGAWCANSDLMDLKQGSLYRWAVVIDSINQPLDCCRVLLSREPRKESGQ